MARKIIIIFVILFALDLVSVHLMSTLFPSVARFLGLGFDGARHQTGPPFDPEAHTYQPLFRGSITWGSYLNKPFITNSLGFKDAATRNIKMRGSGYRVLILGDSFAEGVGVPYEDTFIGRLDSRFPEIEFLNGGVQGTSPSFYLSKLRHLWDQLGLRFDEVVVFLDVSDIPNESSADGCADTRGDSEHRPEARRTLISAKSSDRADDRSTNDGKIEKSRRYANLRFYAVALKTELKRRSMIVLFGDRLKDWVQKKFRPKGLMNVNWSLSLWTVDEAHWVICAQKGVARATQRMSALAEYLRSRKRKLSISVYPWPDQLYYNDRQSRHLKIWRDWAKREGVGLVDLFPDFFAYGPRDEAIRELYLQDDVHFSTAGHDLVARRISQLWISSGTQKR